MINKLVRGSIEMALLSIVYQEENDNRHVHIDRRPCNESVKHEREREGGRGRGRGIERGRGEEEEEMIPKNINCITWVLNRRIITLDGWVR